MTSLLPAERGTRYFFGKPYHWRLVDGRLVLRFGVAEPVGDES